ncbi:hypothetical protein Q9295_10115 [Xinfangfangia sp. CPCC 101601]|uniref:Uncharacterized protein n=1 Tax=Pseudogemmobacter lacusdianii TaxID=3069608 RepID=A0ABU0VY93_9RHOB|nr:hypothetical protein [Xinfangfangia sp. CPCC 101601]MDQ2066732.1 hypothetical protein [Xinfangfangia sp. CPCC 101601]
MAVGKIAKVILPRVVRTVVGAVGEKARAIRSSKEMIETAAKVVATDHKDGSWLQRNWRPLMMLWFGLLIGLYWFGLGPTEVPVSVIQAMFDLVILGIGG